jgi:acetolactate synthase-1/2/3 large subunit
MADKISAGDLVAAFLGASGVDVVYGVASIHNLPIFDALDRHPDIRCVAARGEAGAVNMADGHARASGGIGVALTSTGAGAGNACGSLVEALTAGTPVLHLTAQIDSSHLDRGRAFLHETKDQLGMLAAVSKQAYRVWSADALLGTLRAAMATALTPPMGPVSVEIPIDVQGALVEAPSPEELAPVAIEGVAGDPRAIEVIAEALKRAKRPMLWLGGGASNAGPAATRLANMGFAVVSSQHGRGIVPEDDPMSLGCQTTDAALEGFYAQSDAMLVAGSRLRGNETMNWALSLPQTLYQIDIDPAARHRNYATRGFAVGDANAALTLIADRLDGIMEPAPGYRDDVALLREQSDRALKDGLGSYGRLVDSLCAWMPNDAIWVRDVTLANSIWGNRYPRLRSNRQNVNAVGTGIGQGLPMAIGAALSSDRKTVLLTGDGGLMLCLGELATLAQEQANVLIIVMNDRGYGVIRNIQDVRFAGRHFLADLHTPDFQELAHGFEIPSARAADHASFAQALSTLGNRSGPAMLEVDMASLGTYARAFAGSPVRTPAAPAAPQGNA